jgi:hypothetical protein
MPRPTDIASKATTESRRKGALAANAKRRELGLKHADVRFETLRRASMRAGEE